MPRVGPGHRGFVLTHTAFGASLRAETISGQPSPSRSPIATPYTSPLPSFHRISRKLVPRPSFKKTDPGVWTYPTQCGSPKVPPTLK